MDNTPPPRPPPKGMAPPRPKITLNIPAQNYAFNQRFSQVPQTAATSPRSYGNFNNMQPMTPVADANSPYFNPFLYVYQSKASDFMFKQLGGIKDFTLSTAKSGLSVGEKFAFWFYAKISTWSKKWFTHTFLALVMLVYTIAGAAAFVAVEGSRESKYVDDIVNHRKQVLDAIRMLSSDPANREDPQLWTGNAIKLMASFEAKLYESFKEGIASSSSKNWDFWNAVFYCGTIYTTIGR